MKPPPLFDAKAAPPLADLDAELDADLDAWSLDDLNDFADEHDVLDGADHDRNDE